MGLEVTLGDGTFRDVVVSHPRLRWLVLLSMVTPVATSSRMVLSCPRSCDCWLSNQLMLQCRAWTKSLVALVIVLLRVSAGPAL